MVPAVRHLVRDLDQNLPIFDVKTQVEQIDQTIFQERLFARLSSFFGLLALTLTSVGLYGILAYAVARRTNEIGIRMALGAGRAAIVGMVVRGALALVALGIAIGAIAALAAGQLVSSLLFGLTRTDPLTIAGASQVDPRVALRYE